MQREAANAHLLKVIDAAQALGVRIGRHVRRQRQGPSLPGEPRAVPSRSGRRSSHTRTSAACKIAIENCPMIFSCDEWPGGNNLARHAG